MKKNHTLALNDDNLYCERKLVGECNSPNFLTNQGHSVWKCAYTDKRHLDILSKFDRLFLNFFFSRGGGGGWLHTKMGLPIFWHNRPSKNWHSTTIYNTNNTFVFYGDLLLQGMSQCSVCVWRFWCRLKKIQDCRLYKLTCSSTYKYTSYKC